MSDEGVVDTIHSIEELRLMVNGDLGLDLGTPEAVIVARNVPEAGRRYLIATPEKYPAPDETIDEWTADRLWAGPSTTRSTTGTARWCGKPTKATSTGRASDGATRPRPARRVGSRTSVPGGGAAGFYRRRRWIRPCESAWS